MTLSIAYMIVGGVFCLLGAIGLLAGARLIPVLSAFPRARAFGNVLWAGAVAWFLYYLMTVGEVDLAGFPRPALAVLFGGAGVLAFKYLQDLLSLRALAVLTLFSCSELLFAGFGQTPYSLVLAGTSYLLIIGALWTGAAPYVLRNGIEKLCVSGARIRGMGLLLILVGGMNLVALTFVK